VTRIEILGTGPQLLSKGLRGIEPVIEEIITDAVSEIQILAYLFTPQAVHLLDLLRKAAEKGVQITIVVNSLNSQHVTITNELKSLASRYPHFKLVDFRGQEDRQLHAKLVIADRKKAVVASANLTWGGLYANYEVGLLVEGDVAWKLAGIVDLLATPP
jgi:phosphatidylserine/phosphatidylglycerophosphate/cardiolipin synthase-like enzyme